MKANIRQIVVLLTTFGWVDFSNWNKLFNEKWCTCNVWSLLLLWIWIWTFHKSFEMARVLHLSCLQILLYSWLCTRHLLLLLMFFLILLYIIIRALMFLYYAVSYYVFGTWVWSSSVSEWIYHPQIPFFTTSSYAISNLYNIINTMVRREEYFP